MSQLVDHAFTDLYNEYKERLYNYVYLLVKNYDLAQDITANTFVKMYKKWDQLKNHPSQLAWLYLVARNGIIDHYRSAHHKRTITFSEMQSMGKNEEPGAVVEETLFDKAKYKSIISELIKDETVQEMDKILKTLSLEEQTLIYMRYYEELPFSKLAVVYNKSEDALKMQIHRILKRLKKYRESTKLNLAQA